VTPATLAPWRGYRRLWVFVRPYRARLILILAISLAGTCLGLVQPFISKLLIDQALLQRNIRALVWIAGALFVSTVASFGLNILSSYRYAKVSAAMLFDMRLALFQHLQRLSPRFYARFRLGDLMSRLNNDISEVQRVSTDTLLSTLSNVVFLVGSVAVMFWLNWRLFLVSVVLIPGCLYTFLHYQRKLTVLTKQLRERSADLGSLFVDTILGMRVIVSLRAGEHEAQRFRERNGAFVATMLRVQIASFLTGALPGTILAASTAGVFVYGGWLTIEGGMSIGSLVAFMAYFMRLLSPVQNLLGLTSSLASARVSLGRIFELLDTQPEVREPTFADPLPAVRDSIRLESVSIRYDRSPVLRDVSLEIPAGVFCVILGPSGAGKSTLADLLVRNLDPDAGRILIDAIDLRQVSLQDLRREVILVDQSPYLFNATIAENVAYALPHATQAAIEEACSAAGLDELIERLPQRYQTKTGERGLALSAGERQRIALARAFLRRPSVLILDEPTSALDVRTESLIARNLRAGLRDSTVILITHRPALAELAEMIVTVENGAAQVTREELVQT
jgi:ATP-binding cassette subfamily B protein